MSGFCSNIIDFHREERELRGTWEKFEYVQERVCDQEQEREIERETERDRDIARAKEQ